MPKLLHAEKINRCPKGGGHRSIDVRPLNTPLLAFWHDFPLYSSTLFICNYSGLHVGLRHEPSIIEWSLTNKLTCSGDTSIAFKR